MKFKNLFLTGLLIVNLLTPLISVSASQTSSTPPENQNTPVSKTTDTKDSKTVTLPDNSSNGPFKTTVEPPIEQAADVIEADEAKPKSSNNLRISSSGTNGTVSWSFDSTTGLLTFNSTGTLAQRVDTNLTNAAVNPDAVKKIVFTKTVELPSDSSALFADLANLTQFDARNLQTDAATNLARLFYNDSSLLKISNTSFKTTTTLTSVAGIFGNCSALQTVDISAMRTSSSTTATNDMFTNTTNLWKITFGKNTDLAPCGLLEAPNVGTKLSTDDGNLYTTRSNSWRIVEVAGNDHNPQGGTVSTEQMLTLGPISVNQPVSVVWDNDANYNGYHGSVFWQLNPSNGKMVFGGNSIGEFESGLSVKANLESYNIPATLVQGISFTGTANLVVNSSYLFSNLPNLTSFDSNYYLKTENAQIFGNMFENDTKLTTVSFPGWNTKKVTTMFEMFKNCSQLEKLDLSTFLTTKSTTTHTNMFAGTTKLWKLTLSQNASYNNNWGLLQVPSINTNIIDSGSTYYVKESKWQQVYSGTAHAPTGATFDTPASLADATPEVNAGQAETFVWSNSQYLFGVHGTAPWQLDPVTGKMVFYTGTLQNSQSVTDNLSSYGADAETLVKDISFSGTVTFPMDVTELFSSLDSLTTFNGTNVDSDKTENWTQTFSKNENLTSFTSGSLNTRSATNMFGLFGFCTSLTTLNTSFLDTEKVTDMSYMFAELKALTSLTLNLNTSSATTMTYMFSGSHITSLDLTSFNTGNVKDMSNMFFDCQALKSINLSSFNTQKVSNYNSMFQFTQKLETLDLTPFIIRPDATVKKMFLNTNNLWQIKLGVSTVFQSSPDFTEAPPASTPIPNTTFTTSLQSWQIVGNGSVHHPMGNLVSTSDMWSSAFISRPVTYVWAQEPESRIDEADNLSFSTANLGSLSSFQLGLNNDVNDGITLDYLYGNYNVTVTQAEPWVGDGDVTIDASDLPITYGGQNLSSGRVTFASGNSIADRLKVKYNHDSNKSFAINLDNGSNLSTALGKTLTSTIEWSFETTP
ncbi:BspA family leucine-rich repeat surface protein [Leuconostoc pseudomesenteroides]|uniref:BspA family leucine-rich repeat surface protein n=1 Tax=Leuconostoc pseudomesenteroides TaxID=33968 RepID=A0ABT6HFI0_LEUPS|nr:BspA family leucine-rich repeat surface protein [Leuconostoc pseudomesenteroides]MDG9734262.1 BspA family leucine-rich repeat surface protein [Leuconostoc pseudomesenteroides]NKZ36383.1 BspA family leucine-rich repeat surface protein [Leuconostoc pseudomesenteroides]QQB27442.1 BspA family leucine-rich repeat surface protein [Leuconostoc pseudomesenteroides]